MKLTQQISWINELFNHQCVVILLVRDFIVIVLYDEVPMHHLTISSIGTLYLLFITVGFVPPCKYPHYHHYNNEAHHEHQNSSHDNEQDVPPDKTGCISRLVSRVTALELSCWLPHHTIVTDNQHTIHILANTTTSMQAVVR